MIEYRLVSEPSVDLDVEAAFEWYENERPGLGAEFLDELRALVITASPTDRSSNQVLRGGIRRALLKRFPYAVYFAIEADIVVVVAVLHASRNPAKWQRRKG